MSPYVNDNGKTALLAVVISQLPDPLPLTPFSYIVEVGHRIFARVEVTHPKFAFPSLFLIISFDGDRARVCGLYDPSSKAMKVGPSEPEWDIQRRAAPWKAGLRPRVRFEPPNDSETGGNVSEPAL